MKHGKDLTAVLVKHGQDLTRLNALCTKAIKEEMEGTNRFEYAEDGISAQDWELHENAPACNYCGRPGHKLFDCEERMYDGIPARKQAPM